MDRPATVDDAALALELEAAEDAAAEEDASADMTSADREDRESRTEQEGGEERALRRQQGSRARRVSGTQRSEQGGDRRYEHTSAHTAQQHKCLSAQSAAIQRCDEAIRRVTTARTGASYAQYTL